MTRRFKLLPDDSELGLTPLAWLIYVFIFVLPLYLTPYSPTFKAAGTGALLLFLVLYFRGFWVRGRQLLWIAITIAAIGALFMPKIVSASVFFVYAAAFFGDGFKRTFGLRAMAVMLAILVAESMLFSVPIFGWLPAAIFAPLIFFLNSHFADVRRRNARLRLAQEEVERLARLEERERIARDLHDLLGHTLSVITLKSQLASKVAGTDPERAQREMEEVETISREATNEIRQTVRGYRFQQLGAELAKARVALEVANIELHADTGPFDLPAEHESVLALSLREGVTNVVKHSKARTCWIDFSTQAGDVKGARGFRLVIEDDGRGLRYDRHTATKGKHSFGSGLEGMKERLAPIGGHLQISARAGTNDRRGAGKKRPGKRDSGTRLEVFVPASSATMQIEAERQGCIS